MTRAELEEFRRTRIRHLHYGIGCVRDIPAYRSRAAEAEAFIAGLDSPKERAVMRLLYLRGKSAQSVADEVGMTARNVYRIRRKVLGRLG